MSTTKASHTPGPWRLYQPAPEGSRNDWDWEITAKNRVVAFVSSQILVIGKATPESKANAQLIAAAPDMLKALGHIHHALTEGSGRITPNSAEHLTVQDAIKKARGEK